MLALLALVCAALFAGAALTISLAGHARPIADPAHRRTALLQASLALIGGVAGVVAWWRYQSNWFWLAGGIVLLIALASVLLAGRSGDERLERNLPRAHTLLALVAVVLIGRGILP